MRSGASGPTVGAGGRSSPKGGCAVTSAAAGAPLGAGADPPPGAGTTSMRPTDVASAPTTTAIANPRARRSTRRYRRVTALRPTTWLPSGRTVMRLLVGGERDLALLLEAGAVATARDAVLRLAGSLRHLPAAGTDPVDHADHQLARAHGFTPGPRQPHCLAANRLTIRLRPVHASSNPIAP